MPNLVLLILLTAFPALSTDMYLPALPTLQRLWGISMAQANLSLIVFFAVMSLFLLVHGPLSDRFGRRPVLIWGIALYVTGSFLCATAPGITSLVCARIIQAVGAAAAAALALALAKDLYEGLARQKVLAYIGVLLPLCPMAAPMLGGWMLHVMSWRSIFICQGLLALPALYGTLRLKEPVTTKTTGGVWAVVKRYAVVMQNRRFLGYTFSFSVMVIGFAAFIAGSADIYIKGFGLSEQAYGLYFGFNALALMFGSLVCSRLCVDFSPVRILTFALTGMLTAGAALVLTMGASPLGFALPMFGISFCLGLSRPLSNHMALETVDTDVGSASSLLTFVFSVCNVAAMAFISFDWHSKPTIIGQMAMVGASVPLASLLLIGRRSRRAR